MPPQVQSPTGPGPAQRPSAADWQALFALLDTALELEPEEQARWLAALPEPEARHAAALAHLLGERAKLEPGAFLPPSRPSGSVDALIAAPDADPAPHTLIGPYRVLREIGRGGMASVWLARRADGLLDRDVALKLPHAGWGGGTALADRMARERSILATLNHPRIARLYDAGIATDGRPFLALEFVDGEPIDAYADSHGLDVAARVALAVQVARAVAYAHSRLVVHRDLKPSNILVDASGQVHLLDFGIAKLIDSTLPDDGTATQVQGRVMTPDYASPEQIRGEPIGTASDLYSLGIVLFELLAGERPYRLPRSIGAAALAELAHADIPRLSTRASDPALRRLLAGDLDAIVARALRKNSAERYATLDAFADDLERHLRGEPVGARPDSTWYRADRWVRRHKLESAVGVAIVVAVPAGAAAQAAVLTAIGVGAGVALWQMRLARTQAELAKREAARAEHAKDFALSILHGVNTESGAGPATTAIEVLKSARDRIERELGGRPETAVELMTSIGAGFTGLGEFATADEVLRRTTDLATAELGPRHPLSVIAQITRGDLLMNHDRPAEAIALLRPALAEARRLGLTYPLVNGLTALASALFLTADNEGGLAAAQASVAALPPVVDDIGRLAALNAWASLASAFNVMQQPGQVDAARRSLAFARELHGDRDTEATLSVRMLLARAMSVEGQDALAIAELEALLESTSRFLGPTHPRMEFLANSLGHARTNAGDPEGGIAAYRMQIAVTEATGNPGARLGMAYSSLGKGLLAAHRHAEAADAYGRSAQLHREAAGSDENVHVLRSLSAQALALLRAGRTDDAAALFEPLDSAPWPAGDVEEAMHLGRLSELRRRQGRHDEAIELAQRSVNGVARKATDIVRAWSHCALGLALLDAGRTAEAIAPLAETVRLYADKQIAMSPDRIDAIEALARARAAV